MSLMMVSMLVMRISRAEASAVRIDEVLDSEPRCRTGPTRHGGLRRRRAACAFEHVSFSYRSGEPGAEPVLNDISFVAEPGQTVALLGRDRLRQIQPGPPHPALL